jgi:hypothetical protein
MSTKLGAALLLCLACVAAAPASAGTTSLSLTDTPDPFAADATFAPRAMADGLPGAFELVSFQNAGVSMAGFNEVNASNVVHVVTDARQIAEPISIATFASGLLGLALVRRSRRR